MGSLTGWDDHMMLSSDDVTDEIKHKCAVLFRKAKKVIKEVTNELKKDRDGSNSQTLTTELNKLKENLCLTEDDHGFHFVHEMYSHENEVKAVKHFVEALKKAAAAWKKSQVPAGETPKALLNAGNDIAGLDTEEAASWTWLDLQAPGIILLSVMALGGCSYACYKTCAKKPSAESYEEEREGLLSSEERFRAYQESV